MKNIEQLTKELFKKYILSNPEYKYDYQTFDIIRANIAKAVFEKEHPNDWYSESDSYRALYDVSKSVDALLLSGYIGGAMHVGGSSGGNCWGDDAKEEMKINVQFDNEYLDSVLEVIAPNVTYLTYRKIEKEIIIKTDYTKHEYYGNNDVYIVQLIPIIPLLEMLKEKNVLISDIEAEQLLSE